MAMQGGFDVIGSSYNRATQAQSPARLGVQADRLCHRARKRHDARLDHRRCAVLRVAGGRARQQMLPQLRRQIFRRQDDALGRRAVAQPDDHPRRFANRHRKGCRQRLEARRRQLRPLSVDRAGRRRYDRAQADQRLCDPRQQRPVGYPDADRLCPGPQRQGDLPHRQSLPGDGSRQWRRLQRSPIGTARRCRARRRVRSSCSKLRPPIRWSTSWKA